MRNNPIKNIDPNGASTFGFPTSPQQLQQMAAVAVMQTQRAQGQAKESVAQGQRVAGAARAVANAGEQIGKETSTGGKILAGAGVAVAVVGSLCGVPEVAVPAGAALARVGTASAVAGAAVKLVSSPSKENAIEGGITAVGALAGKAVEGLVPAAEMKTAAGAAQVVEEEFVGDAAEAAAGLALTGPTTGGTSGEGSSSTQKKKP